MATQAFAMAMNRIGRDTNVKSKRALVKQTSIRKGDVDRGVKPFNASPRNLQFNITASGRHFPLSYFKPVETGVGVNAVVWGELEAFPSAFIVPRYSGGVFKRLSARRFPIKQMWGPALPVELLKDESIAEVDTFVPKLTIEDQRLLGLLGPGYPIGSRR